MLVEYSRDDPRVAQYLDWLRWAIVNLRSRPHVYGDYIAVDTPVHRVESSWHTNRPVGAGSLPADGSRVRMGFVRLPFGYGIILSAYQDVEGRIVIVIHGTVVNDTELLELAVRATAYPVLHLPTFIGYLQGCAQPTTTEMCEENDWLFFGSPYKRRFNLTTYWFLWRTVIPGSGYLEVNETLRIPVKEVFLLIEMPMLGVDLATVIEGRLTRPHVFGDLLLGFSDDVTDVMRALGTNRLDAVTSFELVSLALSHPVFGLASNFAWVTEWVAERMATYMVNYGPYYGFRTVSTARLVGRAACEGASASTAMSVSLFGYPAIIIRGRSWKHGGALHDISGYLRLSSMGERGAVQLVVDVDGDGVLDS